MNTAEVRRIIASAIAMLLVTVVAVWVAFLAREALLLIYISVLLAMGFSPIVRAIERKRLHRGTRQRVPRWVAILVVYLAIVAVLTIAALLVIPPLVDQAREMWVRLPGWIDNTQAFLIRRGIITHTITLEEAVRNAPGPGSAVGKVAMAVTRIFTGLFAFVTVLILTFYLLVDSQSVFAGFARLFPLEQRARVTEASNKISLKVSAWLNGQLILAGTIGSTAAIGLYLLGVPYFYVLALIAAIGELVPVIGPVLSAAPAILAGLSVSPQTALFVAIFWIAQQQIENHLLVPKVMQIQVGVSPVVVIAALLIGGSVLGIFGAILAVPTAAIIQVIVQEILDERDNLHPPESV